jgi:hypothetical protein
MTMPDQPLARPVARMQDLDSDVAVLDDLPLRLRRKEDGPDFFSRRFGIEEVAVILHVSFLSVARKMMSIARVAGYAS